MKRRAFLAAAGVGAGAILAGNGSTAVAAEKVPEKRLQVYQCEECGAIVEVLEPGMPSLVHCGKPMKLLAETTAGEMAGKHLPVIEKIEGGYKVTVGAMAHPMLKAHHIAWIELVADGRVCRQFLEVDAKPEAVFMTKAKEVSARALCNLHGLWKK
jgi:superoxide reductase